MNPHTSAHSPGTPPGAGNGVGLGGIGKFVLTNASSTMLGSRITARLAAPCGTIEVTSYRVNLLLVHYSTDCKQQVLRDSAFLGICVVNAERHHGEIGLAISRNPPERGAGDDGLKYPS